MAQSAIVNLSATGTVVAAPPTGFAIRVLGFFLTAAAAVNVKWQSHVTPTDISGLIQFVGASPVPIVVPDIGQGGARGWFQTKVGEALDLNFSGAVNVTGVVVFEIVGSQ